MSHQRVVRVTGFVLLALASFLVTSHVAAQSAVTTYTPSRIQWESLEYKASRMGIKADSDIQISLKPVSGIRGTLIEPNEGSPVDIEGKQVAELIIESTVRGKTSVMDLVLDPSDASAYQRTMLSPRKKETVFRTFRFLDNGVFIRRQQGAANAKGDPHAFPVTFERTIPYDEGLSGESVTEAAALFYMLSAGDFKKVGDTLTFHNFDREAMSKVTIKVEQMTQFDVDYTEVSPSGSRQVKATHPVARLTISGESVGQGADAFEFLGLSGDIEIFADPQLRVPVAVRGHVPRAGQMTVKLHQMKIK